MALKCNLKIKDELKVLDEGLTEKEKKMKDLRVWYHLKAN